MGMRIGRGLGLGTTRWGLPSSSWSPEELGSDLKLWLRPESLDNPNLVHYSTDLTQAPPWGPYNTTVTGGQTDPDGGSTAALLAPTASVGNENVEMDLLSYPADGTVVTATCYIKKGPGHDGVGEARLQLFDGVSATSGTSVVSMDTYQRITVTHTMSASSTRLRFQIWYTRISPDNSVYAAFPQIEVGSAASAYVPNAGATAGGIVASWPDSSGNGNDAAQATQASMPLVVVDALDGKSGALFDNVDDWLQIPDITTSASSWNILAVHSPATYSTADTLFSAQATVGKLILSGRNSDFGYNDGVAWSQFGDSSGADRQEILHYELVDDARVLLNGVSQTRNTGTTWTDASIDDAGDPNSPVRIGADTGIGGASHYNGLIHEFLIIQGALSAEEMTSLYTYLNARYASLGITVP